MKKAITLFIFLAILLVTLPAQAIGPVQYNDLPYSTRAVAPPEYYPPADIVHDAVSYVNSNPYLAAIADDTVYVDLCTKIGTTAAFGGRSISIYANKYYATNIGKTMLVPGCVRMDRNTCIISRYVLHETGHYADFYYLNDAERKALGEVVGGSDRESIANSFQETFGNRASLYMQDADYPIFCGYKWNYKPYRYYYAWFMCVNNDLKKPDFSKVKDRKKGDVDGNGKVNSKDVTLARRLVGAKVTEKNIGQYWSSDMNYDNFVTNEDIRLIRK